MKKRPFSLAWAEPCTSIADGFWGASYERMDRLILCKRRSGLLIPLTGPSPLFLPQQRRA